MCSHHIARTFFEVLAKQLNAYILWSVKMNSPVGESKVSLRENLEAGREQFRKRGVKQEKLDKQFAQLIPPELPPIGMNLMVVFHELRNATAKGMDGVNPISYSEIKAFIELLDADLEPWEIDAIRMMDTTFIQAVNNRQEQK